MTRIDFLKEPTNKQAEKENLKNVKTRTKTPGRTIQKEEVRIEEKKEETDKIDKVIDMIRAKDDKIADAIAEMTKMMKIIMMKEAPIKNRNEEERTEKMQEDIEEEEKENVETEDFFNEPMSTEAMNFFEKEEKKLKENHVKHVLTSQKNILSMSNNFTKQLDRLNRADRADSNIPREDMDKIEDNRRYDAKIVRDIANTVTNMRIDIEKMKENIEKLTQENRELKENCRKNNQINRRSAQENQPSIASDQGERDQKTIPQQPVIQNELPFTVVKTKKTKNKIPPINITPKDKDTTGEIKTPPMAYADVLFRNIPKPPKETITKEQIDAAPDLKKDIENDLNDERQPQQYTKEELDRIRKKIYKSSHIVGIRPVSTQQIQEEVEKLNKSGKLKNVDRRKIVATATKNLIMRFFRDHLNMDDDTRNNIEITKIFPSQNPDAKIMYVQCSNTDEIAKITALAKNIQPSNLKETSASIAIHIPKFLYGRYISIEKLMYQLRMSAKGSIQTNVRLGRTDFIVRQKMRNDTRKWKDITPIEIPAHITKPDIESLKNNKQNNKYDEEEEDEENRQELYNREDDMEEDKTEEPEETEEEEEDQNRSEDDTTLDRHLEYAINRITNDTEDNTKLTETNGSMTQELLNNKHKRTPTEQTTDKRKKLIIPDEYNDSINRMVDDMDEEQAKQNEMNRTPSMTKILNKIPNNVSITKVNTNETTECGQMNQS